MHQQLNLSPAISPTFFFPKTKENHLEWEKKGFKNERKQRQKEIKRGSDDEKMFSDEERKKRRIEEVQ